MNYYKYWLLKNVNIGETLIKDIITRIVPLLLIKKISALTKRCLSSIKCEDNEVNCIFEYINCEGVKFQLDPMMIRNFSNYEHEYTLLSTTIRLKNKKLYQIIYEYDGYKNPYYIRVKLDEYNIHQSLVRRADNNENYHIDYDGDYEYVIYEDVVITIV